MKYWMKVTLDKYELPLAVATSCRELSEIVGVNEQTIRRTISRFRQGKAKRSSYVVVETPADEAKET